MRFLPLLFSYLKFLIVLAWGAVLYAQSAGSSGPMIPSRGNVARETGNFATIQPFFGINANYTNGLTPPAVVDGGRVLEQDSYGGSAHWGATGSHNWRNSQLGLSYYGRYRQYNRARNLDGLDQSLSLGYQHSISNKTTFYIGQTAGTYSRGFGLPGMNQLGLPGTILPSTTDLTNDPSFDLIDTRTYQLATHAQVVHAFNPRWSVGVNGAGFMIFREAPELADAHGFMAQVDAAYRINRRSTVSLDYGRMKFDFRDRFGESTADIFAGNYSTILGRRTNVSLRAGVYRVDSTFIRRVQLDPVIVAILGQGSALEIFQGANYGLMLGFTASHPVARYGSASVNYNRRIVPGNGVYLTSRADTVGAGYNYSGFRSWGMGMSGMYGRYQSIGRTLRPFESFSSSAHVGRRIFSIVYMNMAVGWRRSTTGSAFRRDSVYASAGITVTPREFGLPIW